MELSRRRFLAATGTGGLVSFLELELGPTVAYTDEKISALRGDRITTTICPYCAVGCGVLVMSQKDEQGQSVVVQTEGDPNHPINEGALCPKGASIYQLSSNNPNRLRGVLHRAPGAKEFDPEPMPWSEAAKRIAALIKRTRDARRRTDGFDGFTEKDAEGRVVNRTTAIASVGSAALDNEECWLYQKMLRAMGLVYIEHQARI